MSDSAEQGRGYDAILQAMIQHGIYIPGPSLGSWLHVVHARDRHMGTSLVEMCFATSQGRLLCLQGAWTGTI